MSFPVFLCPTRTPPPCGCLRDLPLHSGRWYSWPGPYSGSLRGSGTGRPGRFPALCGPPRTGSTEPLCGLCALSCIRGRALDGLPGASSIAESRGSVPGPIFSYFPNKSECVPVRYSMRVFPSTR